MSSSSVELCALWANSTHECTTQSSKSTSSLVYLLCIVSCLLCVSFQLLFDDAVVRRTLVLIAFTVAFFSSYPFYVGFCCFGGFVFTHAVGGCYRIITVILHQINVENHSTNNWPNHRLSGFSVRSVLGPSSR